MNWKPAALGALATLAIIAGINLASRLMTPVYTQEAAIEEGVRALRERLSPPGGKMGPLTPAAPTAPTWGETLEELKARAATLPDCASLDPLPKWDCPQIGAGAVIVACHDAAYDYLMRSDGALRAGSRNPETTANTVWLMCAPGSLPAALMGGGVTVHPERH